MSTLMYGAYVPLHMNTKFAHLLSFVINEETEIIQKEQQI